MGFVCEKIYQKQVRQLPGSLSENLLKGICIGLQKYGDLTLDSLKALKISLMYFKDFFAQEDIRGFVLNLLVLSFTSAKAQNNSEILSEAS